MHFHFSPSGALLIGGALLILVLGLSLHTPVWAPLEAYEAQHPQQFANVFGGSMIAQTDPATTLVVIVCLAAVLAGVGLARFARN